MRVLQIQGLRALAALISWLVLPAITRDVLGRDIFADATLISNYLFA